MHADDYVIDYVDCFFQENGIKINNPKVLFSNVDCGAAVQIN